MYKRYINSIIIVIIICAAFFQFTHAQPLPPPYKQRWTRVGVYPEFFRVSTLYRVGKGRTAKKFRKKTKQKIVNAA